MNKEISYRIPASAAGLSLYLILVLSEVIGMRYLLTVESLSFSSSDDICAVELVCEWKETSSAYHVEKRVQCASMKLVGVASARAVLLFGLPSVSVTDNGGVAPLQ